LSVICVFVAYRLPCLSYHLLDSCSK